jgi:hypothetical protein
MEMESEFIELKKDVVSPPEARMFISNSGFEVRERGNHWLMVASSPVHLELEFLLTKNGPEIVSVAGDRESSAYERLVKEMRNDAHFEYSKRNAPLKQKPLF